MKQKEIIEKIEKIEDDIANMSEITKNILSLLSSDGDFRKVSIIDNMRITIDTIKGITKNNDGIMHLIEKSFNNTKKLENDLIRIKKIINIMIFLFFYHLSILFFPIISGFIGNISNYWLNLSEGWQIAVFILIMSIPVGILTAVLSHIIIKKYIK
ncbi:hypothetical protein LAT59_00150 [Candidatus Gracilibacteria bacterium]|nr:hypothetical protein [Candidatus Gracilibacteria bacterium]